MSALTLATEALPAALAVYNSKEVLAATRLENPREILKKALELTVKITIVEPKERVLQPSDPRVLRRSIGQLGRVQTEPSQRLKEILEFEFEAKKEAARVHPGALALAKVLKDVQGPAVITIVSSAVNDSDGLSLALERLQEKGYTTVNVGAGQGRSRFVGACLLTS